METFQDLKISRQLQNAIDDLGFEKPTPIQSEAYPILLAGKNLVGIAQTGTGKTIAYGMPLLQGLKFSKQVNPRVLILVPTRELVVQVVEELKSLSTYITVRILGVYGGTNINTQRQAVVQGCDILVATPGRLYDLALSVPNLLKSAKKLVIDEVDIMLDLGFVYQLTNIFELLPERRQNIMFSATMTEEVDLLIKDFFINPVKVSIALSGTPLANISQACYAVKNFYTKANLLIHLLADKEKFKKVLVFVDSKKVADRLYDSLIEEYFAKVGLIHSNKSQNFRLNSIQQFDEGTYRILIATDVIARGLDLDKISHVINFDTPKFPENYMHRIGRTGRAKQKGNSILFYSEKERELKSAIEELMSYTIPELEFPENVAISNELAPEERERYKSKKLVKSEIDDENANRGFHEKIEKNKKVNLGGSYRRKLAEKYKKPKTRGDKKANQRKKRK